MLRTAAANATLLILLGCTGDPQVSEGGVGPHTHHANDVSTGVLVLERVPHRTGSGLDADLLDGEDSAAFSRREELAAVGTVNAQTNPVDWTKLKNVPEALADGADQGVLQVSVTAPLATTGGQTPLLSLPPASATADGYLAGADWTRFDAKVGEVTAGAGVTVGGTALAPMVGLVGCPEGEVLRALGGGWTCAAAGVNVQAPLLSTGGDLPTLSLPAASATVDGYLSAAAYQSFDGRVSSVGAGTGISVGGTALDPSVAVVFGTAAGTVAEGNDPRFSDTRAPAPGSANYVQNQSTSDQSASFRLGGSGVLGGRLGVGAGTAGSTAQLHVQSGTAGAAEPLVVEGTVGVASKLTSVVTATCSASSGAEPACPADDGPNATNALTVNGAFTDYRAASSGTKLVTHVFDLGAPVKVHRLEGVGRSTGYWCEDGRLGGSYCHNDNNFSFEGSTDNLAWAPLVATQQESCADFSDGCWINFNETTLRYLRVKVNSGCSGCSNNDYVDFWKLSQSGAGAPLYISRSGQVGIGGVTTPGSSLSVRGALSVGALYATAVAPANGALFEGRVGIGNPFPSHPLQVGNAYCDGNTWVDASSRALKEDIRRLEDPLAVIEQVDVYRYRYRNTGTERIGVIAEDVPEVLSTADRTGVVPGGLAALSIAANRALGEKVRNLEDENVALKARLDALEARLSSCR